MILYSITNGGGSKGSPKARPIGIFYEAALVGEEEITLSYLNPKTEQMYDVTLPNGNNILEWACDAQIGE